MSTQTLKMRIQLRRAHTADWIANKDVVPAAGEPCFDLDLHTLKIGDGVLTYENLPVIGGEASIDVAADGKSIVLEDNVFKLVGFDAAETGAQPRKKADGTIEWIVPSTETVDGIQVTVAALQSDVASLQAIVGVADEGSDTLINRIAAVETGVSTLRGDENTEGSVLKIVNDAINKFATDVTDDGVVNSYKELIDYVAEHGGEAAEMAANITALQALVGTDPVSDQIAAAISEHDVSSKKENAALYKAIKYEISSKPVGTLVDYRDKEIRVMCPVDTAWTLQESGENADSSKYYIGFKAYAPSNDVVGFKEDLAEIISDETLYSFEGNEFAGIDTYGRKYSIVWLPVAKYDESTSTWTYYGKNSSKEKYIGWYYSVEWYNADGKVVASDTIRINLANEDCFNNIKPFYLANVENKIEKVALGGTLLDVVEKQVNIPIGAGLKASGEIEIAKDGTIGIKQISIDKVVQAPGEDLILDGGGASN